MPPCPPVSPLPALQLEVKLGDEVQVAYNEKCEVGAASVHRGWAGGCSTSGRRAAWVVAACCLPALATQHPRSLWNSSPRQAAVGATLQPG